MNREAPGRKVRVENMPMGRGEQKERRACVTGRCRAAAYGPLLHARWAVIALATMIASGSLAAAEFGGEEPVAVRNAIGDGMHAYFAGDYDRSYDALTNAIEAGTDDPRGYYFRGLAALRLGRTSEAEADFTTGADRELATGSMRRVSQSLERVQGHDRLTLERFRSRARLGALQRDREAYGRRYSTIEDASGDVRRRRRPEDIRPELVAPRGVPIEEVPAPVAKPAPAAKPAPTAKPAPAAKPGDGFSDEPAAELEEPAPESADPFGDEPAAEMEEPAAESDDPFGGETAPRKSLSEDNAAE